MGKLYENIENILDNKKNQISLNVSEDLNEILEDIKMLSIKRTEIEQYLEQVITKYKR